VHAVLGNHDWWQDVSVQLKRSGPVPAGTALKRAGIPVYENSAVRLVKDGRPFWLAGLGDQWAYWPRGELRPPYGLHRYEGVHDLAGTLAQVTDNAPVILLAHEPDIFPEVPDRVAVTLSGHTHGGQVTLAGYAPIVPSRYGRRYVYGHIVEGGRNLVVSGGLGCSGLPVRFGRPPEIVLVELGAAQPI
ncbi:MAG: metallophosphoesterase, partial [Hyphomicrobiaceae bacterium]|nr:metallophosphoesterase [Hyphomicrobiaceae bacterium]